VAPNVMSLYYLCLGLGEPVVFGNPTTVYTVYTVDTVPVPVVPSTKDSFFLLRSSPSTQDALHSF
jgi:hypothetical protein